MNYFKLKIAVDQIWII